MPHHDLGDRAKCGHSPRNKLLRCGRAVGREALEDRDDVGLGDDETWYYVVQADSGETALARLADFAFDVLVTDLRLPGIDGAQVVEAADGRGAHRDLVGHPVVEPVAGRRVDVVAQPALFDVTGGALAQSREKEAFGLRLTNHLEFYEDEPFDLGR